MTVGIGSLVALIEWFAEAFQRGSTADQ